MRLTRATLHHLPQLVPLFDGYRVFYGQASDLAAAEAFLQQNLAQQRGVIWLALETNQANESVGLGFCQLYPSFSSVAMQRLWILNDLFVAPQARRRGVARLLMQQAADFARQDGACKLTLETAQDNHSAQTLYQTLGYKQDTDVQHYTLPL